MPLFKSQKKLHGTIFKEHKKSILYIKIVMYKMLHLLNENACQKVKN